MEDNGEMEWLFIFGRQDETYLAYICVIEVQMDIWVWVLLHLRDVAQLPALESLGHGRCMWGYGGPGGGVGLELAVGCSMEDMEYTVIMCAAVRWTDSR
jgi:hypothetical protein